MRRSRRFRRQIQMGAITDFFGGPGPTEGGRFLFSLALLLLFHGQEPLERRRQVVAVLGRRRNGHPVVLALLHRQAPTFVFQRLRAQRLETVQAHHHELALLDRQAVARLAVLLQKRKVLNQTWKPDKHQLIEMALLAPLPTISSHSFPVVSKAEQDMYSMKR